VDPYDDWAPLEALSQRAAGPDPGPAGRVPERGREVRNRRRVATGAGVTRYPGVSGEHVNGPIEYEQGPPVGGDHNATRQNCGFYAEPIADR
jgi:hypothetical protein